MKIPYMAIIGKKEIEEGTISLRKHTIGDIGEMSVADIIKKLGDEIDRKS